MASKKSKKNLKKVDKMLDEAQKRLHTEWKQRMPEPWSVPKWEGHHKWKRDYYGSPHWAEDNESRRTWYVQPKSVDDSLVRAGFSITFVAIILIVTKMIFF